MGIDHQMGRPGDVLHRTDKSADGEQSIPVPMDAPHTADLRGIGRRELHASLYSKTEIPLRKRRKKTIHTPHSLFSPLPGNQVGPQLPVSEDSSGKQAVEFQRAQKPDESGIFRYTDG